MRGAQPARVGPAPHHGIIPAYAGSTNFPARHKRQSEDHPRVCGEHQRTAGARDTVLGSSPRMRGALADREWDVDARRIIPAYAGSTDYGLWLAGGW